MERGYCLSSEEIRKLFANHNINEKQIQPSSFDATIGDEVYIVDTQLNGIFRPNSHETVYETLRKLKEKERPKFSIQGGFEIKRGFAYLIRLKEKVTLKPGDYVKSSPKSSLGRLFLHTRLLADYNPCFDELHSEYCSEMPVSLWLLLQPLAFNLIIHPGNTLNQLRFFKGDATLSTREVKEEHEKNPLLLTNDNRAVSSIIRDGMQLHLDLSGEQTGGILALKARHNPMPIDLGKINHYNPEDYFQAIYGDKKLIIEKGEHYLFFTKEYLNIPAHLSSELNTYSHVGLNGPLHFAGFIDNGFAGHLVFEIRSDELSNMILDDNMPISRLVFYRTTLPKKLYGKSIGSTYHSQTGLKVAKYFYPIRYE